MLTTMHSSSLILALLAGQLALAGVLPPKRALVTSFITTITTTVPPSVAASSSTLASAPSPSYAPDANASTSSRAPGGGPVSIGLSLQNGASIGTDISSILSNVESAESKGYTLGGVEVTFLPEASSASYTPTSSPQASAKVPIPVASQPSASSTQESSSSEKPVASAKPPPCSPPQSHTTTSIAKSALSLLPSGPARGAPSSSGIQIIPLTPSAYTTSTLAKQTFTMPDGSAVVTQSSSTEAKTTYVTYASKVSSSAPAKSSDSTSRTDSISSSSAASTSKSSSSVAPAPTHPSSSSSADKSSPAPAPTPSSSHSVLPSPSSPPSSSDRPSSPPPPPPTTTPPPPPPTSAASPSSMPRQSISSDSCPYPGLQC